MLADVRAQAFTFYRQPFHFFHMYFAGNVVRVQISIATLKHNFDVIIAYVISLHSRNATVVWVFGHD